MTEQELLQIPEELREVFRSLDAQGWNPELCDTPVPYYDNAVPCGQPVAAGDIVGGGFTMLPCGGADIDTIGGHTKQVKKHTEALDYLLRNDEYILHVD